MSNCISAPRFVLGAAPVVFLLAASLHGGTFSANFDDGEVPAGTLAFGTAVVEPPTTGEDACLVLTRSVPSQSGSFIIEDLDGGVPVYGFRASFLARIGGGGDSPADGWSFSVAPNIGDAAFGEEGTGSGLSVCFDSYINSDMGETSRTIDLKVGGQVVASRNVTVDQLMTGSDFAPVVIAVNADGSFDLSFKGVEYFTKYYFPGYEPLVGCRLAFGARTGGAFCNHFFDDLTIETYLDPVPGFLQGPGDQTVIQGSAATFSVALNNGDFATIEWLRNGAVIPGANGTSYTLGSATLADSGAKFSVRVTAGSTVVTSAEATLTVVQITLPATPLVSYDFNDGWIPAEAAIYGAGTASDGMSPWEPYISLSGGVGDSGVLQLTESYGGQDGAFLVSDLHAGAPVYGVAARFDLRIGGGTEVPADGLSFNFADDLPDSVAPGQAEEGVGSGLSVCFDIYDNADGNPNNGVGEAPAITLKWNGGVVGEVKTALSDVTTGDGFADVTVRLTVDGLLDVAWNGKVLLYRAPVPGFGTIAGGRFGFYARTGGSYANQWIDNLRLYTYLTGPLRVSKQPAPTTVLVGKTATFDVEVSTSEGAAYQWFRNGTPIGGATSSTYTTPATMAGDDGVRYKVEVTVGAETVSSEEATLTVVDLTAPSNPQLSYDFNSGLPAGADIGGSYPEGATPVAYVDSFGGVGNSGVLKLTTSENSQAGGFRSALVQSGAQLLEFTLAADVLAGNGMSTYPADGFSICLGSDLPITAPGDAENGAGTGITVAFDTYDNDDGNPTNEAGEAPSIDIRYKGRLVAVERVPLALLNSGVYAPVLLRVQENGILDLAFGDTVVYHGLQITNYVPMSAVKIGLYGRTGGANASYWIDNLRLGVKVPESISISIEPSDTLVLASQPATFSVQASNPQGVTYQWRRNGVAIGGATQASYTTPALSLSDEGAAYSVVVTGPGNAVTSRNAIVTVMEKFSAGTSPAVNLNFNDMTLPEESALFGSAWILDGVGVNNTPCVILTEALEGQSGSFVLQAPAGSTPIADFTATWMMLIGGGPAAAADGASFVLGQDIPDGAFGEGGTGSGLIVSFDTYDNGDTEVAPEISVTYRGNAVATRPFDIGVLRTGTTFKQVGVRMNRNGTLDVYYGDTAVYRGLVLPSYAPFNTGRFGWGARTGGLYDNHWMDDVKIALNTQPAAGPTIAASLSAGNLVLSWSGGGTLQSTTTLPGAWSAVVGATSGYTVPANEPARYYRVVQ